MTFQELKIYVEMCEVRHSKRLSDLYRKLKAENNEISKKDI